MGNLLYLPGGPPHVPAAPQSSVWDLPVPPWFGAKSQLYLVRPNGSVLRPSESYSTCAYFTQTHYAPFTLLSRTCPLADKPPAFIASFSRLSRADAVSKLSWYWFTDHPQFAAPYTFARQGALSDHFTQNRVDYYVNADDIPTSFPTFTGYPPANSPFHAANVPFELSFNFALRSDTMTATPTGWRTWLPADFSRFDQRLSHSLSCVHLGIPVYLLKLSFSDPTWGIWSLSSSSNSLNHIYNMHWNRQPSGQYFDFRDQQGRQVSAMLGPYTSFAPCDILKNPTFSWMNSWTDPVLIPPPTFQSDQPTARRINLFRTHLTSIHDPTHNVLDSNTDLAIWGTLNTIELSVSYNNRDLL